MTQELQRLFDTTVLNVSQSFLALKRHKPEWTIETPNDFLMAVTPWSTPEEKQYIIEQIRAVCKRRGAIRVAFTTAVCDQNHIPQALQITVVDSAGNRLSGQINITWQADEKAELGKLVHCSETEVLDIF